MRLSKRMYQSEDDYSQLRALLRKVFLLNGRQELIWQVARLDYWRYFGNENIEHYRLNDAICLLNRDQGYTANQAAGFASLNEFLYWAWCAAPNYHPVTAAHR